MLSRLVIVILSVASFVLPSLAQNRGPSSLRSHLVKRSYGIRLPLHQHAPRARFDVQDTSRSGIIPVAQSVDKQSYYSVMQIGGISFRIALDTASSDLWIVSSDCRTKACSTVPRYPLHYHSSTFVSVNGNSTIFKAGYADSTVASGFVAKESIQLSNITLANQAFAVITDSNVTMTDQTSGVLGLGFQRLSSVSPLVTNSTPFFATLAQQGLLNYPVFGLSLTRNATGSLALGAVDASIVTDITFIDWNDVIEFPPFGSESNVSSYLHWAIPLRSISVNGVEVKLTPTYTNITKDASIALFDAGAAGLYGPYPDVSRIFSLIDSARLVDPAGQWALPCDSRVAISFAFGRRNYTLQPTDYIIGPASGNPNLCLAWPRALPPSSDGIDWQIGAPFLRTVYSIYSYGINTKEPPMIGLYPLQNATTPQSPEVVASFLSSISATVETTLPNFLVPTPTYTTPSYTFNTSVSAPTGGIVTSGLGTSTYSPILGERTRSVSLPTISPSPTLVTFIITDSAGDVFTSTSTRPLASPTLGVPPGWTSAAFATRTLYIWTLLPALLVACFLTYP